MIAYFPPPYEDELLYSWLARYYSKSGYMAYTLAAEDLFVNKNTKPSIEFICRLTSAALEAIERYVPRATLIEKHTMFPHYARFLDRERRGKAFDAMVNMDKGYFNLLCVTKNRESIQRYLRYCPTCVTEDRAERGETYWHRIHQVRGVNVCPMHGCNLIDAAVSIDSKGSPSLITAEEIIPQVLMQYHMGDELEWRLARYIADVFQAAIAMQSDVLVGDYLHYRMERTKYLSQRGEKRNMALLHADFQKFYRELPVQRMEQWKMQKIFSGDRVNTVDVCALVMFLNIPPSDLVRMRLPKKTQEDIFDAEIRYLHGQGQNYRQIAVRMGASYDVVKAIGEGVYGKYHYRKETPQKGGTKRYDWGKIDNDMLPKVKKALDDIQRSPDGKPQRISVGRIERALGLPKKYLRQCQRCIAEIEKYVLTQEEHWKLLVDWAAQKLTAEGKDINITAIMRLTNMRKRDFERICCGFDGTILIRCTGVKHR